MGVTFVLTRKSARSTRQAPIVFNPVPQNDQVLRIALACCGFGPPKIEREKSDRIEISYTTEPLAYRDEAVKSALDVKYDAQMLHTLLPIANVDVGSLAHMMPSTRWTEDDGVQVIRLPVDSIRVLHTATTPTRPYRTNHIPAPRANGVWKLLALAPVDVPGVFTRGHTRFSKRLREVDGVRLRTGDIIQDVAGDRWYFYDGMLRDRLHVDLDPEAYEMRGRSVRPKSGALRGSDYVPGALYELTYAGKRYAAKAMDIGVEWGWTLDPMEAYVAQSSESICMMSDGTFKPGLDESACANVGGAWDRPCTQDQDCPFYDPRRARGGCLKSGFCEFPLGIEARSYRTHTASAPLMRGCDVGDPTYPWCSGQPRANARFRASTKKHRDM